MDCFVLFVFFLQEPVTKLQTVTIKLSLGVDEFQIFPVSQCDLWIFRSVRCGRRVCWIGYRCRLPTVCNNSAKNQQTEQPVSYDGSGRLCITDFSVKGLRSRLLSWPIFPQQHITTSQLKPVFSHFHAPLKHFVGGCELLGLLHVS